MIAGVLSGLSRNSVGMGFVLPEFGRSGWNGLNSGSSTGSVCRAELADRKGTGAPLRLGRVRLPHSALCKSHAGLADRQRHRTSTPVRRVRLPHPASGRAGASSNGRTEGLEPSHPGSSPGAPMTRVLESGCSGAKTDAVTRSTTFLPGSSKGRGCGALNPVMRVRILPPELFFPIHSTVA